MDIFTRDAIRPLKYPGEGGRDHRAGARWRRADARHRQEDEHDVHTVDREDIHAIVSRLDDVLDLIEETAERLVLYAVKEPED